MRIREGEKMEDDRKQVKNFLNMKGFAYFMGMMKSEFGREVIRPP